jgi:hypothetical protein
VEVVGLAGGSLLVVMIEAPHFLHTHSHSRSSLYIYNAIQHLLQWLVVISMQLQPDICSMEPERGVLGVKAGFSVGSYG